MKLINYPIKSICMTGLLLLATTLTHAASAPLTSIQNASIYTFSLTNTIFNSGSCNPSCVSQLAPGAIQTYNFTSSTGSITFKYKVLKDTTYVGQVTLTATPSALKITNGLGASSVQGNSSYQINYTPPTPLWKGRFTSATDWRQNNWNVVKSPPLLDRGNVEVRTAQAPDTSPLGDYYLRVRYPAKSANPGAAPPLPFGGLQFYASLLKSSTPITLSYYVRFPSDFPFINPAGSARPYTLGKLPGLYSGTGNTGDKVPTGYDGWTIRFMWCDYSRETGKHVIAGGEVVQFTYGSDKGLYSSTKGKFIGCGKWTFFKDAKWHNIQQTIHLNSVGSANGRVDICYDGQPVYTIQNIMFTKTASLLINGIIFQTFFGGSGSDYATPTNTYVDFADFALYNYPTSAPPGQCVTNLPLLK